MSNIQELMCCVIEREHKPALPKYVVQLTPNGAHPTIRREVRYAKGDAALRLLVQSIGKRAFPQGFTFTVRPM